jgi:CRISPR system Cascade subunit CasC
MFIDLHILQTVPLANLNRDDVGSPKTLPYGGVRRLRVSSQSWKRAARQSMEADGLAGATYRTRHPDRRLAALLEVADWPTDAATSAAKWTFLTLGTGAKKEDKNVILFASDAELTALADLLDGSREAMVAAFNSFEAPEAKPKAAKGSKGEWSGPSFDEVGPTKAEITAVFTGATHGDAIGLFGRMLASDHAVDVDAAVQVAHAMGTHPVEIEFDYFTAAEDIPTEDEGAGAAMIESSEFASSTLYRYATVDVDELIRNCGGDAQIAAALAQAFIMAFALSMPSGKKNSTAPNSPPAVAAVTVRDDRPVSFAGAFESPVRAKGGGFEAPSAEALDSYAERAGRFVSEPLFTGHTSLLGPLEHLGNEFVRFEDLAAATAGAAFTDR